MESLAVRMVGINRLYFKEVEHVLDRKSLSTFPEHGLMPASQARPWTLRRDGVALTVRLTPKSARDALEGIEHLADGRAVLKARVRAVPEAGAANAALIRLLVEALSVPARAIRLESGATSRVKTFFLEGDAGALETRLIAVLGGDGESP